MARLVWLVTGCSSGLGQYLVKHIAARGDIAIATARDITKISASVQSLENVSILPLDVNAPPPAIQDIIAQAVSLHGHIDVLVNNAGFIQIGTLEELQYEDWVAQFETNVFGPIKVAKAVLPHFRDRKSGTLAFVGSLSGWVGHEVCGAYAGSKFALEGIVEALHRETAGLGVRTLMIEPGRFRTNFLSPGNMKATSQSNIPAYTDRVNEKLQGLAQEDMKQPGDPEKLVNVVVDLIKGEGVAEGRDVPLRVPLGVDCYDGVKRKCEETLKILEDWKSVTRSTDFD